MIIIFNYKVFKKITKPRELIQEFLKNNKSHPQVQDIFLAIKKKYPKIGYATIYRNLKILKDQGLIQEIKDKNGSHFDPNTIIHPHFKCIQCDKIYDIPLDISNLKRKVSKSGYKIKNISLNLDGLCKQCNLSLKSE